MSWKLAEAVLDSALDSTLKPTCVVLALFGNDDGSEVRPALDRVAWRLGISRRAVSEHVTKLCETGILRPLHARSGGSKRPTRYCLDVSRLPRRPAWSAGGRESIPGRNFQVPNPGEGPNLEDFDTIPGRNFQVPNPGEGPNLEDFDTKPGRFRHETWKNLPPTSHVLVSDSLDTAAAPPMGTERSKTPAELSGEPNRDNYKPLRRLAYDLIERRAPDTLEELTELLKDEAARLRIDRGAGVGGDVVHRAATAAWTESRIRRRSA